jgi:hypothetical protein
VILPLARPHQKNVLVSRFFRTFSFLEASE